LATERVFGRHDHGSLQPASMRRADYSRSAPVDVGSEIRRRNAASASCLRSSSNMISYWHRWPATPPRLQHPPAKWLGDAGGRGDARHNVHLIRHARTMDSCRSALKAQTNRPRLLRPGPGSFIRGAAPSAHGSPHARGHPKTCRCSSIERGRCGSHRKRTVSATPGRRIAPGASAGVGRMAVERGDAQELLWFPCSGHGPIECGDWARPVLKPAKRRIPKGAPKRNLGAPYCGEPFSVHL
jgi:hypothetical protein